MEEEILKEKIRHNFSLLETHLNRIYKKSKDEMNEYDFEIQKRIEDAFELPTGEHLNSNLIDALIDGEVNHQKLGFYLSKIVGLLEKARQSEEYDEQKKSITGFHGATLSTEQLFALDEKFSVKKQVGKKRGRPVKTLDESDEVAMIERGRVIEKIRGIFLELEPHLRRIYHKFPRNRNERDKTVVIQSSVLFDLDQSERPTIKALENLFSSSKNKDLEIVENKMSNILTHSIQAEELDKMDKKMLEGAIKDLDSTKQDHKDEEFEKLYGNLNQGFFDRMMNKKVFRALVDDDRRRILDEYDRRKVLKAEREKAKERIESYKKIREQEEEARHLASLAEMEMEHLETELSSLTDSGQSSQHLHKDSKWERMRKERVKELESKWEDAEKKLENYEDIKKSEAEARHGAALASMEMDEMEETLSSIGEGENQKEVKYKWDRLKDERDKLKKSDFYKEEVRIKGKTDKKKGGKANNK